LARQLHLRFVVVMTVCVGIVLLTYGDGAVGTLLAPLTAWTTHMTLPVLHWSGMEATRTATVISHPGGFAYEITYRCTGFLPVAFLTAAILASPGSLQRKVVGLTVGVPVLIGLNLTRLVHLFYVGVHNAAAFHVAHTLLWEGCLILAILGLWLGWMRWSESRATTERHQWARQSRGPWALSTRGVGTQLERAASGATWSTDHAESPHIDH
jgi:exosortase H (IPTLxxWG-CTERM-specific)